MRLSYLALAQTAQQMFVGTWLVGEMGLPRPGRNLLLPTAIYLG